MDSEEYPYISKPDHQPAYLRRTPRIRVAQIVMDYLAHGWSVEEMCRHHNHLTKAEAHAAMLYYWDHQAEIDDEIHREWSQAEAEAASQQPPPVALRLIASRSKVA